MRTSRFIKSIFLNYNETKKKKKKRTRLNQIFIQLIVYEKKKEREIIS